MSIRIATAMCTAALLVLSGCGSGGNPGEQALSTNGAGPSRAGSATETACQYVEARPTYLPWLDEGEEVPDPRRDVEKGSSYVSWSSGGDDPSRQKSVILRRNAEPLGGMGEPVPVRLEGAAGYYYSAPGPQASVLWKTDSDSCSLITLTLSLPGSDRHELRDEILKIVESLEGTESLRGEGSIGKIHRPLPNEEE